MIQSDWISKLDPPICVYSKLIGGGAAGAATTGNRKGGGGMSLGTGRRSG